MITVITVGKIKEKYFLDAIEEYSKRLTRYTKINFIEVKDESSKTKQSDIDKILKVEEERILSKVPKDSYIITLEIEGKSITSTQLSEKISSVLTYDSSNIVFIIGGSHGLSSVIKCKSDYKLSFSKFTFPHQLMKVVLLEQIYRAFTIINNVAYHK